MKIGEVCLCVANLNHEVQEILLCQPLSLPTTFDFRTWITLLYQILTISVKYDATLVYRMSLPA